MPLWVSKIKKHPVFCAILMGLCFCLAQISFTWFFAPKDPVPAKTYFLMVELEGWNGNPGSSPLSTGYLRLNNWDSLRFFELAQNGYHLPSRPLIEDDIHHYRANVTTPPAYPMAVRLIQNVLRVPGEVALLVTAQLACWIFWVYFILFLMEIKVPQKKILWSSWVIAVHPAAFYMVVGYTESFFIATMMGFIYWTNRWLSSEKSKKRYWILAACHGFLGTATRIAGFPLGLYPFSQSLGSYRKKMIPALFLFVFSILGLVAFFVFCQVKFGQWNLYFKISSMVSQTSQYLAVFNIRNYIPHYFFEHSMVSLNRSGTLIVFVLIFRSLIKDSGKMTHLGFYLTAFGLLYVAISGKANSGMDGMIRYTLPVFVMMVACLTQVQNESMPKVKAQEELASFKAKAKKMSKRIFWIAVSILSLAIQGWTAHRFLHGRWVS